MDFFRFPFFSANLFEAIPEQSALIIECNDITSLNEMSEKSPFWSSVQSTSLFEKIQTDFAEIQSRLLKSQDTTSIFENNQFIAALQMSTAKSADFLYAINSEGRRFDVEGLFEPLRTNNEAIIKESIFHKEKIYQLKFTDSHQFTVCFYGNIILFARFPFMVEDAVAQLKNAGNSASDQAAFQEAKKSIKGKPGVSVYFNFRRLAQLIEPSNRKGKLSQLESLSALATLNFYTKGEEVTVDGTFINHPDVDFKSGDTNSAESKIFEVIPDNCSFVFWESKRLENLKNENSVFSDYIKTWIGDERAVFLTESRKAPLEDEQILVFKTKDAKLAEQTLEEYAASEGKLKEYDYQTFTIKKLFSDEILKPISDLSQNAWKTPFYTIIEDFVIFTDSRQSLEGLIQKHILGQTLSNNPPFLQYQNTMLPGSNTFFYSNISLVSPFLRQLTSALGFENDDAIFDILYHFKSLGVQLERSGKRSDLQLYLNNSKFQTKPTKTIWTAELTANAAIPPAVVKNQKNGQNEIFVQDADHRIYLFDRNGQILWERKLDAQILSEIHEIQYYESGETQLLFNTENRIYIIDHEGKDIGNYPLKLTAPATNGVCVVDFENDGEYQFFVACENGHAYAFEKAGASVAGWNPGAKVGRLSHDIQHFQVGGKDYILALGQTGDFNVFKRNGTKRFETVAFDTKMLSPLGFQLSGEKVRFVFADEFGKARVFKANGKHFNLYVGTGEDKEVQFLFSDVIGDARKDYISLSGRDLSCHFYKKSDFKKGFNTRFEAPQDELFEIQIAGNRRSQIGTLNKANKRINLLDRKGRLVEGFPLAGTTRFSIVDLYNSGSNVLVVALENKVYSCKMN